MAGNRFHRFRELALAVQHAVARNRVLAHLERRLAGGRDRVQTPSPPIFIIGSPRTGSTILYQWFLARYRCAYPTNLHALFISTPALLTRLLRPALPWAANRAIAGQARWGYLPGILAPSEAGALNQQWFGNDVPEHAARSVRHVFSELEQAFGGPVVIKNLRNTYRVENILSNFPDALIVAVDREPVATCLSILRMADALPDAPIFPPEAARWCGIRLGSAVNAYTPAEQAVLRYLSSRTIVRELMTQNPAPRNIVSVTYEDFCTDPVAVLEKIERAWSDVAGRKLRPNTARVAAPRVSSRSAQRPTLETVATEPGTIRELLDEFESKIASSKGAGRAEH